MNCRDIQERFDERLDHRLPVAEQQAFDQHVADCAACRQQWQVYAGAWEIVARQTAPEPSVGFVERTLRRLDEPAPAPHTWLWLRWRWAAFAVVVVGLIAGGWLVRQHQREVQLAKFYSEVRHNDYLEDYDVVVSLDQLEGDNHL